MSGHGIYFNEIDRFAAGWLKELFTDAAVDARSIVDVKPEDVIQYRRCHFFGGIGGWEYALRLACWPVDREVWTGSCPCQPFSCAGKQLGNADKRHLWPDFRLIIAKRRPATVFGEQVASKDGRIWLDGVRADMEELGYAFGAADLCAASIGAPHIRQRLYWVADSAGVPGTEQRDQSREGSRRGAGPHDAAECAGPSGLGDTEMRGFGIDGSAPGSTGHADVASEADGLVYAGVSGLERHTGNGDDGNQPRRFAQVPAGSTAAASTIGFWRDFGTIPCRDGKTRRVEPGTFPLAHGVPNRVGRLRGYGNAIVPQVAAEFIGAFLDLQIGS